MDPNTSIRIERRNKESAANVRFTWDAEAAVPTMASATFTLSADRGKVADRAGATTPTRRVYKRLKPRSRRRTAPSWRKQLAHALKENERSQEVTVVWRAILDLLERTVPAARPSSPGSDLSAAEAAMLARGSSGLDVSRATTARALARTAGVWADLLAESADVSEVAGRLGVQESRIRQRLADRTLYGFKHEGVWYIPRFQFYRDRLLPGIAAVVPRLPETLAPLAVASWFVTPTADLVLGSNPRSPRDWLVGGGDPSVVVALASEL